MTLLAHQHGGIGRPHPGGFQGIWADTFRAAGRDEYDNGWSSQGTAWQPETRRECEESEQQNNLGSLCRGERTAELTLGCSGVCRLDWGQRDPFWRKLGDLCLNKCLLVKQSYRICCMKLCDAAPWRAKLEGSS